MPELLVSLAISRSMGMTLEKYFTEVSPFEHRLRLAEYAINPYGIEAIQLAHLCSAQFKTDKDHFLPPEFKLRSTPDIPTTEEEARENVRKLSSMFDLFVAEMGLKNG